MHPNGTATTFATFAGLGSALPLSFARAYNRTVLRPLRNLVFDTVDVQLGDGRTERLRLIGIDTPEVVDPRKPVQCFGREASSHTHELLRSHLRLACGHAKRCWLGPPRCHAHPVSMRGSFGSCRGHLTRPTA
jgi:Staphylococcal nuclease homologue